MLAINESIPNLTVATPVRHRNYESRESDQQTQGGLKKPSSIRNPHVVISRQNPFAANVVPTLVSMATFLRPSISAMSSLDNLFPKIHP